MTDIIGNGKRMSIICGFLVFLLLAVSLGCGSRPKVFVVGIVNDVSVREPILDGFMAGMAELGYVKGKDIEYIYNGPTGNRDEDIDLELKKMQSRKLDLLLVMGNWVVFRIKNAMKGTSIPVIAVGMGNPVESGLVDSLGRPGGGITGVQIVESNLKALEWLQMISPGIKKVYVPFDATDPHAQRIMEELEKNANKIGVELALDPVQGADEATAAIGGLPDDIGAVYRLAAPCIDSQNEKLTQAAIERRLPIVATLPLDEGVLLTCATSDYEMGRQSARFADQIRRGAKPADLPVETAEMYLTINLKTAYKLGLHMPDIVLMNAKTIIR